MITVQRGSAYTVVTATYQPRRDSQIWGCRRSETPEPIDTGFCTGNYVFNDIAHANIKSDRPIGGVLANG